MHALYSFSINDPIACSLDQMKSIQSFKDTARSYFAINKDINIIACSRDPTAYEFWGPLRQSTDAAASVHCPGGARTVTPEEYIEAATALQPDFLSIISDEIPFDSKKARATQSVDRTVQWIEQCFRSATAPLPPLFLTVQGSQYVDERQRASKIFTERFLRNDNGIGDARVIGIAIGGLGTGESPELRKDIIAAVIDEIPVHKARMIASIGTPEEILSAVQQGIDIFDAGYIADVTAEGYALNFPLQRPPSPPSGDKDVDEQRNYADSTSDSLVILSGCDDTKLNLWATTYKTDSQPIVANCPCIACRQHTRGYLHHLLQSHEMTAQVLLEAHNTTHYLRFFENIRRAIEEKRFDEYYEWMATERKRRWVMGGGACA